MPSLFGWTCRREFRSLWRLMLLETSYDIARRLTRGRGGIVTARWPGLQRLIKYYVLTAWTRPRGKAC